MRGQVDPQGPMFSYFSVEERIPADHPLRRIKLQADAVLGAMNSSFDAIYAEHGRASVAPERLLKASLLIALYSVRSDRLFCEMLDYNMLFRWFLDMDLEQPSFDHSTFSKNRARLIEQEIARGFFAGVIRQAREQRLLSDEHFTVDGTLIESWASLKSLKRKDGTPPKSGSDGTGMVDFKGEKRGNKTHESSTDPEAKLMKKGNGQPAKLSFGAHALMENRSGLLIDVAITDARLYEPYAAEPLLDRAPPGASGHAHAGCRQGLLQPGLRREAEKPPHRPAHLADRRTQRRGARWPDHTAQGLRDQPAQAKAHRGDLRLDEDHRRHEKEPLLRHRQEPACCLPGRCCLQPATHGTNAASDRIGASEEIKTRAQTTSNEHKSSKQTAAPDLHHSKPIRACPKGHSSTTC
jgi:transposase